MSDDNNHEDEQKEEERAPDPLAPDLLLSWRWISPFCTVLYLYLTFTAGTVTLKLIGAFLALLFAASTTLAWRSENRVPKR